MPPKLISLPPDAQFNLLEKWFRIPAADKDKREQWLLNREFHFHDKLKASKKDQLDNAVLEDALSEIMAGDRVVESLPDLSRDVQEVLKPDREQERKLARERILKMTGEEMKKGLKEQLASSSKDSFSRDNLINPDDFCSVAMSVGAAASRAQDFYNDQKDKEDRLRSLCRLLLDLGRAMPNCNSIEAYLSASNLLFWSAKDVLDLTLELIDRLPDETRISAGLLKGHVKSFFQHYVFSVLLVESASRLKSLLNNKTEETLAAFLKQRLGLDDKPLTFVRSVWLFKDQTAYRTTNDTVDPELFAKALAKVMREDLKKHLPLEQRYTYLSVPSATVQQWRQFQIIRDEGEFLIRELLEGELVERLVGERWIECIGGSDEFLMRDLLLPGTIKQSVRRLVEIVKSQRENATQNNAGKNDLLDDYKYVNCFITELGNAVEGCKDMEKYIGVSVFLFGAAAELWRCLPKDDSHQTQERREGRAIVEKLLRNYLALVFSVESGAEEFVPAVSTTKEAKATAPKTEAPKTEAPQADSSKANAPKADTPKADAPNTDAPKADVSKTEQSSTDSTGAANSQTAEPKTGDSETQHKSYVIPRKPVPQRSGHSTFKKWRCCVIL